MIAHLESVVATGRSRPVVYDTTTENDLVWGVGLGCNGKVTLLLERMDEMPGSLTFAQSMADRQRTACILATVYQSADGQGLGTRFGLADDGSSWESDLPESWRDAFASLARSTLERARSVSMTFDDLPGSPGVFCEYIAPTPRLLILGAGDDAQPLAEAADTLGWSVTVADPRAAFATPGRFPTAKGVLVIKPEQLRHHITPDLHTFAVVMTHHYVHDLPFLAQLIGQPIAYLGLLGPKKRADRLLDDLRAQGCNVSEESLRRLHAPVGLDLGGDAPQAVALSILAEMQAVLHARGGAPLRLRNRPIHDPSGADPRAT